jgi:SAM-dependent methyltransferase
VIILIAAIIIQIILFIVLFLLLLYFGSMMISDILGVPFVPTTNRSINNIFNKVRIKKNDYFYDLGCGDGRLVFFAAQKYGCSAIGFERNPLLHWFAVFKKKILGIDNATFIREDLYQVNLHKATIIYLFLFPEVVERLKNRFIKQCRRGTVIISHGFKIKGWEKKLTELREGKPFSTYYYQI